MGRDEHLRCVLLGGGGHARVVMDAMQAAGMALPIGILDNDPARQGTMLLGVRVLGGDELLADLVRDGVTYFAMGLGGIGDNRPRRQVFERAHAAGLIALTVCHPSAVCSSQVSIGEGCVLLARAVVNPGTILGANVIINTGAIVEHDCAIGDHAHVATGATLCGSVRVGAGAHIGAGATVRQGMMVGEGAIVGAGAVAVRDVAPWTVVTGVPARRLDRGGRGGANVEVVSSRSEEHT